MSVKLSTSLGLREKSEKDFNNMLSDMNSKWKKQQLFTGIRNTFEALESHPDMPENRKFQNVSSTVDEQLDWFREHSEDHLSLVLTIEKTNAQNVTAELVVGDQNWGIYTTLELLRLKGILDKIKPMIQELPIRSETSLWKPTKAPEFEGRVIWETPIDTGNTKTTLKRIIVVDDPHVKDSPHPRQPVTQQIDTPVNTGNYTRQEFSGAITNRERAEAEVRLNNLYKGVIAALETANNVDVQESDLGRKTLEFLF